MDSGGAMEPLVGRVEEQRQIAALLAAVRDGRTRVLFITGPAGIGKSRLAGTIASELPTYTHLLLESEREVAFGAIDRLIDEQLPETAPELMQMRDKAGVPTFAIGIVNLIERLDGPFALVIDDLHHLDKPSQEAFWHVIRRLDHVPALFVATSRSTQGSFAERIIQHVTVGRRGRHIHLGPLTSDAVQSLMRNTLFAPLHPRQTQKVMDATGGSPAMVTELVSLMRRGGGTTLDAALAELERRHDLDDSAQVAETLRGLTDADAASLLAIALGGPLSQSQLDHTLLALGHPRPDVHRLRSTGLLDPGALRMPRRSVAAAVVAQASPAHRAATHQALAMALTGVESLRHRMLAGAGTPDPGLIGDLLTSARAAAEVRDFALASRLMAWASEMDESYLPLACLHALRARRPALLEVLEPRIKALLPGLERSLLQCALDVNSGVQTLPFAEAIRPADLDDTHLAILAHALVVLGRNRASVGLTPMPQSMAAVRGELTRRLRARRSDSIATELGASEATNLEGLLDLWLTLVPHGSDPSTPSAALDALAASLSSNPVARIAHAAALSAAAALNHSAMRNGRAQAQLDLLAPIPAIHPDFELSAALIRHRMAFKSGEWDAAQAAIEPSLALALEDMRDVGALQAQATAGLIPFCRSDEVGARMLDHVTALAASRPFSSAMGAVLWARGWAATVNGDPRVTAEAFGRLWSSPLTGAFAGAESAVLRVRALVALDDLAEANVAGNQLSSLDVDPGALSYLRHHIDALLAMGTRDHAAAEVAFAQAHTALENRARHDSPRGLHLIQAVFMEDWARFHVDTDRGAATSKECMAHLHLAIGMLLRVGARRWAERLESLLAGIAAAQPQAPDDKPVALPPDLLSRLTAREREITHLALEGHSNKEIAQILFLSVRTVEFHVRNALAKLGAGSRVQLRELLARKSQ